MRPTSKQKVNGNIFIVQLIQRKTVDFMLSAKRDRKAAKSFFKKALSSNHNQIPKIISVE